MPITPLKAFVDLPTSKIITNGDRIQRPLSRSAVGPDKIPASMAAVFAALIVGVPIAPNAGDAALPIRQITADAIGSNPRSN